MGYVSFRAVKLITAELPLRGARTLMRLAHLISVGLVADIMPTGRLCCVVRYDRRGVRPETFRRRRGAVKSLRCLSACTIPGG